MCAELHVEMPCMRWHHQSGSGGGGGGGVLSAGCAVRSKYQVFCFKFRKTFTVTKVKSTVS